MSGWNERSRSYELTATKAKHWHRHCPDASSGAHISRVLVDAGHAVSPYPARNVIRSRDGLDPESSVYAALRDACR